MNYAKGLADLHNLVEREGLLGVLDLLTAVCVERGMQAEAEEDTTGTRQWGQAANKIEDVAFRLENKMGFKTTLGIKE